MSRLLLLTGDIHTGKSGRLLEWARERIAAGFVTPTIDGQKKLLALGENIFYPFETQEPGEETIGVGRYHLLKSAFEKGTELARSAIQNKSPLFVFDEWGKLERDLQGFHPAFELLLKEYQGELVVVVRNSLLSEFRERCALFAARFTLHPIEGEFLK